MICNIFSTSLGYSFSLLKASGEALMEASSEGSSSPHPVDEVGSVADIRYDHSAGDDDRFISRCIPRLGLQNCPVGRM